MTVTKDVLQNTFTKDKSDKDALSAQSLGQEG
jgi:hypothetical protein